MRRSRVTFDIDTKHVETIVGLLIDRVQNFSVTEIPNSNGTSVASGHEPVAKGKSTVWMEKVAPAVLGYFKQNPGKMIYYRDKDLDKIAVAHGYSPSALAPILSHLRDRALIERPKRGHYRLRAEPAPSK